MFRACQSRTRAESDIASTRARLALNTTRLERTRTLRRCGVVSEDAPDQALSRQSELEGALASLTSARRPAEVALDATRVLAPFDGRVLFDDVELGAVVGAGQAVATLASTDDLEVTVTVTVSIGYGVLFGTVIILGAVPALFIAQAKLFRTFVREPRVEGDDPGGASTGALPALAT